jgi:uncharacterized membrane protein YbhN (UPF0104 family)
MGIRAKKIYHAILFLLSIALLIGVIIYVKKNPVFFQQLKNLHIGFLILLITVHALGLVFLGLTHQLPLKKHNLEIKTKEWYGLAIIAEMFNMILPANGGTGIRMMYLKDKKNLPIRQFLSMNFAMIVTGFTMLGIIGTLYFQYVFIKSDNVFKLLESLFTALALSGILLLIFSEIIGKVFKIKRKYSPKIYLFDSKLTGLATLYWLFFFALYPLKIYLSFLAIGEHVTLGESFEISLILLATFFFQVMPGNLGVKEIVTAYVSSHYGINFETAILASLIDRGALVLFVLPVGAYFYWELFLNAVLPKVVLSIFPNFRQVRSEQT